MQKILLASVLISLSVSTARLATADEKLTPQQIEALFDQLVITAADMYVENGRGEQAVRFESDVRINRTMERLHQAGSQAWPHWVAHLEDPRPSTYYFQGIAPSPTIGMKCDAAIRHQLIDLPKDYQRSKTSADNLIDFEPSLRVWLEQRKAWTRDELRCDVLARMIKIETEVNRNPQSAAILQTHLRTIQARVAASKNANSKFK